MTLYRDLPTAKRMETAGDIAQGQFESWANRHGLRFRPFGVEYILEQDRQPVDRYRPDYDVEGWGLVEVMSTGPNGHLRLKFKKLDGLNAWKPYRFWIYDPVDRQGGFLSLAWVHTLLFEGRYRTAAFEDEGTKRFYYSFDKVDLAIEWEAATEFIESGWKAHGQA